MDTPRSDLEAIRQILADLTARVYRIERRLQMDLATAERRLPAVAETPGRPLPSAIPPVAAINQPEATAPRPPYLPPRPSVLRVQPEPDLESRIGSHWLNPI